MMQTRLKYQAIQIDQTLQIIKRYLMVLIGMCKRSMAIIISQKKSIENAQQDHRPSIIIGNTIMAKGTASMEGDHNTHGAPLPQKRLIYQKRNWVYPMINFIFLKK